MSGSRGRYRKNRIACIRKTAYRTFDEAEARASHVTQREGILVMAYPCELRGPQKRHWHIGKEQFYAPTIRAQMTRMRPQTSPA